MMKSISILSKTHVNKEKLLKSFLEIQSLLKLNFKITFKNQNNEYFNIWQDKENGSSLEIWISNTRSALLNDINFKIINVSVESKFIDKLNDS